MDLILWGLLAVLALLICFVYIPYFYGRAKAKRNPETVESQAVLLGWKYFGETILKDGNKYHQAQYLTSMAEIDALIDDKDETVLLLVGYAPKKFSNLKEASAWVKQYLKELAKRENNK